MQTGGEHILNYLELDKSLIWHPFNRATRSFMNKVMVKGRGVHLYDLEGNAYLDGISSWWVNLHGHSHPHIIQKIHEQAQKLEHVIFADCTHPPAIELASRLLSILPGESRRIFYSDNGSTAVEVAIKIALQYFYNKKIKKKKVVCFEGGYHGDTFGAMSVSGKNRFHRPFWDYLFEVETIKPPIAGKEESVLKSLKEILKKNETACFIFEPQVLGAGGMVFYSLEALKVLIDMCHQQGVLTVADEVMTGFGRTGPLFVSSLLPRAPDIICLSKGLTGGFLPMGATVCSNEIFEAFCATNSDCSFLHGHSYTANPLACASALASLDLLLEKTCCAQRRMIEEEHRRFCEHWQDDARLNRIGSLGTILSLEYASGQNSYFNPIGERLSRFFIEKNILLRPLGNVLYVMPPYCIQKEELASIYQQIAVTIQVTP